MPRNSSITQISESDASEILDCVLEACNAEGCNVPLDVLSSYAQYRRDRFTLQKRVLMGILFLFLLLPLCFLAPKLDVSITAYSANRAPHYLICVDSLLPVSSISATLDGKSIMVYETDGVNYTLEPPENGKLTVAVTVINKQYALWSTDITQIDNDVPEVTESNVSEGILRIFVKDEGSGVDYDKVYAAAADGDISPLLYSEAQGYLDFPYIDDMNIFIPDCCGNTLQLVLVKKN